MESQQYKTYGAFILSMCLVAFLTIFGAVYFQAWMEAIIALTFLVIAYPLGIAYLVGYYIKDQLGFAGQLGEMGGGKSEDMESDPGAVIEDMVENLADSMEEMEEEGEK